MINKELMQLRCELGVPIMAAKKALSEADGDITKAKQILRKQSRDSMIKKNERKTSAGRIEAYVHGDGKIGVLVEVQVETDFVAKNEAFKVFVHELVLQITATYPEDVDELLSLPYIRDESMKISDLLTDLVAKIGENVKIVRFERYELGK